MCHEAGQSAFLHPQLFLSTSLIIPYLATFLGTNSLSVLMYRKAVNQSIKAILYAHTRGKSIYIPGRPLWCAFNAQTTVTPLGSKNTTYTHGIYILYTTTVGRFWE